MAAAAVYPEWVLEGILVSAVALQAQLPDQRIIIPAFQRHRILHRLSSTID
jgi:hypothetical protein